MADTNEVGIKFSAQIDGLKETMAQATEAVRSQTQEMKGHFDTLVGGIQAFKGAFVALAAITAGGSFLKSAVSASKEFNGEVMKMSKLLGVTATEGSYFVEAMKMSGGSTEQAETAVAALTRTLRTTPEKFDQLGVATRDANGQFRPMQDILLDVNDKFKHMEDGTGKNVAMAAIFGRQWTEVGAAMKVTKESLAAAREEAESLGLVVTKQSQQDVAEYKTSMAGVKSVLESITKVIGDAFMPILTELGNWFKEIGPAAFQVMHYAIGTVASAFWALREGVIVVWETINFMVNAVAIPIQALGTALYKLVHGDFKGAADEMTNWPAKVGQAWDAALINIADGAEKTREKVKNLFAKGDEVKKKEGEAAPDLSKDGKPKEAKSQVGEWERINKTAKESYEYQNGLQERSLTDDVVYWQSKLAVANKENGDLVKVEEKLAAAKLAVMKKSVGDAKANSEEAIAAQEKAGLDGLAADKARADQDMALGKITADQLIALEIQAEDKKFQIQQAAQLQRIKMAEDDPSQNTAALQAQKDKLLEIERAYQVARTGLQTKAAVENQKYATQLNDSLASGFSSVLKNFATGTVSIQQLFVNMGRAILTSMTEMFANIAAKWLANQVMQKVGNKVAAIGQIMGSAAAAGAAAFASTAAIPVTGPAMAPAAAESAYAGAASFAAMPGFAVGSWDVPGDMFTKIHKGEMIVPAQFADSARDGMLGGKQGGDTHVHINATDAQSVARLFRDNGQHLVAAIQKQRRNLAV